MASNLGVGGPCCFAGHIAEGTPEGVFKELGGVRTYVAAPKDVVPKKAIILFTDVFGVGPPNSQLMADKFASEGGFLVAVPDLFGDSAPSPATMDRMLKLAGLGDPPAKSVWEHLWRYGRNAYYLPLCVAAIVPFALANFPWTKKEPLAQAVYNDLKANHGIQHFGVVGYCYGGGFCLKWASEADKVDAFVVAHTQIKVPDSLEKLEKPGLIICAERDFTQSEKEREKITAYVKENLSEKGVDVAFYPGTYHGFAIRGNPADPIVQKALEDAFRQTLACFKQHVGPLSVPARQ